MTLSPSIFDSILATGDLHKPRAHGSKPDAFGVNSLELPRPASYESLDAAVESLRRASKAGRSE